MQQQHQDSRSFIASRRILLHLDLNLDQEKLGITSGSDTDISRVLDHCSTEGGYNIIIHANGAATQDVQVSSPAGFGTVMDLTVRLQKTGINLCVRGDIQRSGMGIGDDRQKSVHPLGFLHHFLFDRRFQAFGQRLEPHLNESHGSIRSIVDLGMPHASAHGSMLHPALSQNSANPVLISVPEFAIHSIRHHFDITMRMKRPDGSRREGIIIEDAEQTEICEIGIVVIAEAEMPAAMKRAVLNGTMRLVDAFRSSDSYSHN